MGETIKLTQEQKHEHRECLCYHCNNLQEGKEQIEKFTNSSYVILGLFFLFVYFHNFAIFSSLISHFPYSK